MLDEHILLHMDLKDFFMKGTASFLVAHSSLIVPMKVRPVFRTALSFILSNQYITTHSQRSCWWKVVIGSGMGMKCSSAVADAAFLHAVELQGPRLITRAASSRFGIVQYSRYRDNLLFVLEQSWDRIRSLRHNIMFNIQPYAGTVEEASHIGVTFLDTNIVKDDVWKSSHRVSVSPHLKPSSLRQVLNPKSSHQASIHVAWMKAYIFRLFKHSTSMAWFLTSKSEVLSRLRSAGIDQSVISIVDADTRYTFLSHSIPAWPGGSTVKATSKSFWIKLPYHAVWSANVDRNMRLLSSDPQVIEALEHLGLSFNSFRIAWSLVSPALQTIVRKY